MDQLPGLIDFRRPRSRRSDQRRQFSQPGTIEFLRSRGFGVVAARKGPGSVREGIMFMQGYQLVIDPDCEAMRNEAHDCILAGGSAHRP